MTERQVEKNSGHEDGKVPEQVAKQPVQLADNQDTRKPWHKPTVRKLMAYDAEATSNTGTDGATNFS